MRRLLCILSGMNVGGAETFLMKLYRNLDREKYQMDFCINDCAPQTYEKEIIGLGGRIFRVPHKSKNLRVFKKGLFDVVRNNGYKHVLRVASNGMGFLDLKIAYDAGARVCAVRTSSAGGNLGLKAKIAHIIGRVLYGRYVKVKIAPSDLAAIHTFGRNAYKNNDVFMLRNAVDLDVFRFDMEARQEIRKKYSIPADANVIGTVGQLRVEKNQGFLMRVFAHLCRNRSDVYLLLVGTGDQEDALKQLASELKVTDKVVFAGLQRDVHSHLSAMDVFTLPSLYEGMPNAVIEAQATGLPCVISDTISREANITGLVKYLPLGRGYEFWADVVSQSFVQKRHDTTSDFIKNGYEIKTATKEFERIIFENDCISA